MLSGTPHGASRAGEKALKALVPPEGQDRNEGRDIPRVRMVRIDHDVSIRWRDRAWYEKDRRTARLVPIGAVSAGNGRIIAIVPTCMVVRIEHLERRIERDGERRNVTVVR